MSATNVLLKPEESVMLLVDFQAGLGFGVESTPRQVLIHNAVALARTAVTFKVPVVYKCFWSFSATGRATKRMKPRAPSSWRMAGAMEWVSHTRER